MESNNRSKNHHYVQQAYLKNFACNEKNTHIWEFDKYTNIISDMPKKIKEVAKKDYFYPQWLEVWFNQNVESDGIQVIRDFSFHKSVSKLKNYEKKILLEWIFIQIVRTVGFQNFIFQSLNTFLKQLENKKIPSIPSKMIQKFIHSNYDLRKIPKYKSQFQKIIWNFMTNKDDFTDSVLTNHKWSIIENRTNYDYLTSDDPVIWHCFNTKNIPMELNFEWYGNNEVFNPDFIKLKFHPSISYHIPLSSKLLLLISNIDYNVQEFYYQDDINHVIKMNELITTRAYRYIFAEKRDFKHAFLALEQFPESRFKPLKEINPKYMDLSIERTK